MPDRVPTYRRPDIDRGQRQRPDVIADPGVASNVSGVRIGTAGKIVAALALLGGLSCGRVAISSCGGSGKPSYTLGSLGDDHIEAEKQPPNKSRTLQEIDGYVRERDSKIRAYEEAERGENQFQGFSCTGKELADGNCR
ncbi:MAG: hypothetical protein WCX95_01570 [Candidatus Gracilibacteria bacterium]